MPFIPKELKHRENYLLSEKGYVRKRWRGRIPIALVFPNAYALGMSNLGFLYLYERLNSYEEIVCERFFWEEGPLRSLENNRPLKDFSIILFTLPFEGDFVNVLKILKACEIPLEPEKRDKVVLAGGVALWANPMPLSPFLDGALLGEWEAMEREIIPLFLRFAGEKEKLLEALHEKSFFFSLSKPTSEKIKILKKTRPEKPIISSLVSERAQFKGSILLEVSKGCGRACRFCLAGYIYRPPRGYSRDTLLEVVSQIPHGAKVGLIGLEFIDREEVLALGKALLAKGVTLTFSSLRIDALTEEFLALLTQTKSIALAPETASERLKRVINKWIPNDEVLSLLERLALRPLKRVKLYFMFGLPSEKEEDLWESIKFIKDLKKRKFPFAFRISFSPFVPKPHTPFQWAPFNLNELEEKKRLLERELRGAFELKIDSLKEALLQALLARGDASLKEFLLSLSEGEPLKRALKKVERLEAILSPPQARDFPFPWDRVDISVSKEFLFREWKKAMAEKLTPFCEVSKCKACGACVSL